MNHATNKLHFARLLIFGACCLASVAIASANSLIEEDVLYRIQDDIELTYDVIPATKSNQAAVLFMASGGWFSDKQPVERVQETFEYLLSSGYTVISIRHRSAPEFKVPDAVSDVQFAARHVRYHAEQYGIDPNRLAAMGYSSGGHLALMIALDSDEGVTDSNVDSIQHASNRVAATVAYFPPVDLVGLTGPNERFPALDFDPSLAKSVSPIHFVDREDPPVLLLHGTADDLVPLDHSTRISEALEQAGVTHKLSVFEGAGHGFRNELHRKRAQSEILTFLNTHLAAN